MKNFFTGKVILSGEHSVVYGYQAILASLSLGTSCQVKDGDLTKEQKQDAYLQKILAIFAKLLDLKEIKVSLQIESNLPMRSGLGSSAAFAAAVFSALADYFDYSLNRDRLYNLVLEAENFIHGKSSGADPAIVTYGGLLSFSKGKISPLQSKALKNKNFFSINSGEASESTGEMVSFVAKQTGKDATIKKIGNLSQQFLDDLLADYFNPELFNQNQALLEELGVVSESAKKIIHQLQKMGAFCKITGAGGLKTGSGFILAYSEDKNFENQLKATNLEFFKTQLGINEKS